MNTKITFAPKSRGSGPMVGKRGLFFIFHISYFITLSPILPLVSPQKYWNKVYRYLALAGVLLVLIGAAIAFLPKINQFQGYQDTKSTLEADIRSEEERIQRYRMNQEKFSTDKHFVQKIAHEIGFAHEGETIYQFNEPSATNTSSQKK